MGVALSEVSVHPHSESLRERKQCDIRDGGPIGHEKWLFANMLFQHRQLLTDICAHRFGNRRNLFDMTGEAWMRVLQHRSRNDGLIARYPLDSPNLASHLWSGADQRRTRMEIFQILDD